MADLSSAGIGCHYMGIFVGSLAYADNLTLLAASPSALCLMLLQCEKFGKDHGIRFNPNKTQLICFRKWGLPSSTSVKITFAGKQLTSLQSVKRLGQLLTDDLRENAGIQAKSTDFIRRANSILVRFSTCTPYILCYLIRSYCTSFYGCSTWSLVSQSSLYQLQVHMNKICRRIWHLVWHTHSNYCHLLSGLQTITNLVYGRCNKLVSSALCSNSSIVRMVYSVALNNCRNFVGCNRRYGYQSVRHYSVQDIATSLLINDLKSSVFVSAFLPWGLDTLLHQACTR